MTVPKLRFAEFKDDWRKHPLSDAWQVKGIRNYDGTFNKSNVLSVSGEAGVVNQIEHLGRSYAGAVVDNYHVVEQGDIVYTKSPLKDNPYGIIRANRGDAGIVSTLYAVYEVKDGHDPHFWDAYFALDDRTNRYLLPLVHKGAKNDMKINNDRVLIDPVYSPSLPEQQKIVAFLSTVDRKRKALRQKRDALLRFKTGLAQKLFSQELRFSREDGSAFPNWDVRTLGDIGDTYPGLTGKSADDFGEGKPFITYRQIFAGAVADLSRCGRVAIGHNEKQNRVMLGDALVTTSSETPEEVGFASVVLTDPGEMYLNSFCFGYRYQQQILIPEFAVHLFRAPQYRKEVVVLAQGSTRYNISKAGFMAISLRFPKPDEQLKIAGALSTLDAKIAALHAQILSVDAF